MNKEGMNGRKKSEEARGERRIKEDRKEGLVRIIMKKIGKKL